MKCSMRLIAVTVIAMAVTLGLCVTAQAQPMTWRPPAWAYPNAKYQFDFSANKAYGAIMWYGAASSLNNHSAAAITANDSGAAANTFYSQDPSGILKVSPALAQLRVTGYGMWGEGGPGLAHNYALQSRNFTNASWTLSNITATRTSIIGADGSSGSASQLTATAGNGTALQTIAFTGKLDANNPTQNVIVSGGTAYTLNDVLTTVGGTCTTQPQLKASAVSGGVVTAVTVQTAGACTVLPANPVAVTGGTGAGATFNPFWRQGTTSAWMKCVTCTGPVSLTMDNGSTYTDISAQLNTGTFKQARIATQTLLNNTVGIKLTNSGDVVVVDFFQTEDDDQATSPVVTTTVTSLRGPEFPTFGSPVDTAHENAGLPILRDSLAGHPVSLVFQYSGNFSTTLAHQIWNDGAGDLSISGAAGGGILTVTGNGGSFASTATDTSGLFTLNKVAVSLEGDGSKICVNGSAPTKSATVKFRTVELGATHGGPLNNGTNLIPTNGYDKMISIFWRPLTDGECTLFSTVTNNM